MAFVKKSGMFEVRQVETDGDADSAAVQFVGILVTHLEASLQLAQTNVLSAAKHSPAHGNLCRLTCVGYDFCMNCINVKLHKMSTSDLWPG